MYTFCPFCGQKLPQGPTSFVFCPFCGKGLAEPSATPASLHAISSLAEKKVTQVEPEPVKTLAEPSLNAVTGVKVEVCNLILKDCSSPDLLKRRLTGVLLRSPLAIQMAVDRLPSMLLYKSRTTELPSVMVVLRETKSALTVVDAAKEEDEIDLSEVLVAAGRRQEWVSSLPEILWQGEGRLEYIETVLVEGQETLLLSGASNLFLIDATAWKAKTLGFLEKVLLQTEGRLRLDEWQIDFSSEEVAAKVYARIKRDSVSAKKTWIFHDQCTLCASVSQFDAHTIMAKPEPCLACGGICTRTVLFQKQN